MKRKRILFVINSLAGGGAERVMVTLLRHSEAWRDRYDLSLALLDEETVAYPAPDWVPVHRLDSGGALWTSVRRLRALVRRERPDLVLSFLTRANVAACLATAGTDIPFIVSERVNTDAHLSRGPSGVISRRLVRATYPRAARVLAVSQGVADDLARLFAVPRDRLAVIANPVDGDALRTRAAEPGTAVPERPYVVAMGRLTENKNFPLLIDAFTGAGVEGRLVILGEGPDREALERRIGELGMTGRILLPGFADNPFPLIAAADCYVLSSNAEGFPNGLVEAMAIGVPVIATDCPSGPAEILAQRPTGATAGLDCAEHGLIVPCEDRIALAEGLRRYQDPAVRAHYADAARKRADAFSVEVSVAHYWTAIESVLEGASAGAGDVRARPAQKAPSASAATIESDRPTCAGALR
ncbi:glycosyltransferase [Sphingosinicella sp. CPCC 101087]|uniref:glycosyltransferase n=1 Tax=Sphingosinicella sp. CPCC 101087 TaxID=2497754 RepID=UPI00101DD4C0|nr:glycosyltransferase [Sphingosinicella sp. CPCC 101087]